MAGGQTQLVYQVEVTIKSGDIPALQRLLAEHRPSDIAEVVEVLDLDEIKAVFGVLNKDDAAEVLEKVDEATRAEIIEVIGFEKLAMLIENLSNDDATDIILELDDDERDHVLPLLPQEQAHEIRDLMSYSEDSAGGIMDPVLIWVRESATVAEAVNKMRAAEIDEDFYSVFVVDRFGRYVGEVRLRFLLTAPENMLIVDLIESDNIYVRVNTDQEEVRNVFSKNDLITVPVLSRNNKLVGRITADRVIEVAEEEAAEDLYAMAGTDAEELEDVSIIRAARIRMTWLLPCLVGTGVTAMVLMFFNHKFSFEDMAIIYTTAIAFVPMIAAISGNAGLQTSAIVVSGLATGHLAALKVSQVFDREVRIAFVVAISCGILGGLGCLLLLLYRDINSDVQPIRIIAAFTVGMFSAIMVATTLGLFLPFLFKRVGIDPAISSGPLVTTANDSISVTIYLTLTLLLSRIG